MYLADSPEAFLGTRPPWTLDDAALTLHDGRYARLLQQPFHWVDGNWQAMLQVRFPDATERPEQLRIQIAPETLRRWSDVAINPFLEACAQLRDHLQRTTDGDRAILTLL